MWHKIPLDISSLVLGDFAAGAVLITFGVLLGKVNPAQMLFICIVETIFFSLNERIGLQIGAADIGGTMTIHMSANKRPTAQSRILGEHTLESMGASRALCNAFVASPRLAWV